MDGMGRGVIWRGDGREDGVHTDVRRRRWPVARKAAIVAESFAAGAKVSEVAARHGVKASVLSSWRGQAKAEGGVAGLAQTVVPQPSSAVAPFVPVTVNAALARETDTSLDTRPVSGVIEIVVADASIRVVKGVDAATLSRVLAAVRCGR
jgi:transposase